MGAAITTEPVCRIVLSYSKTGPARYLGHLDLLRVFQRAARRAGLHVAYSKGFNPHPRMMFASPLPVGAAGLGEMAAMDLVEHTDPLVLAGTLNSALPDGIRVGKAWVAPLARGTFGAEIRSQWFVRVAAQSETQPASEDWERAVSGVLDSDVLNVERQAGAARNVRSRLISLSVEEACGTEAALQMVLLQRDELSAKPRDVVSAIEEKIGPLRILSLERRALFTDSSDRTTAGSQRAPVGGASRAPEAKSRAKGGE